MFLWDHIRWRAPVRAVAWDGMFPIELPGPEALAELAGEVTQQRGHDQGPFDLVVDLEPGVDLEPWRQAGATWILTDFGPAAAGRKGARDHRGTLTASRPPQMSDESACALAERAPAN